MAKGRSTKKKSARTQLRKPEKKAARRSAAKAARKPARTAARKPAKVPKARARRTATAPQRPPALDPVRLLADRIVALTVAQDDEASFGLYADDVESIEMGMPPTVGIPALREKFAMWRSMVSSSSWSARNVWVQGNTIIIEWNGHVTLAATGREVDLNEIAVHEVADGKIVRERFYYDRTALQP
jgi:ketosteroid isomerase-like protein